MVVLSFKWNFDVFVGGDKHSIYLFIPPSSPDVLNLTFFFKQILKLKRHCYLTYMKITKRLWPQEKPCCMQVLRT